MLRKTGILLLTFILMVTGCSIMKPQTRVNRNLSYLYTPGRTPLHPSYIVYHSSDTISTLKIKIQPLQLLFNQANKEGKFLSSLSFVYRLYEVGEPRQHIADSGSVRYFIDLDQLQGDFQTNILLHCTLGNRYILEVIAVDQVRKTAVQQFLSVDKESDHTAQDFLVTTAEDQRVLYSQVLDSSQRFHIRYRKGLPDTLYVSYFLPDTVIPPPPDLMLGIPSYGDHPDSTWKMHVTDTTTFTLPDKGVYFFRTDSTYTSGLPLFNFGHNFPYIRTPEQMVFPLTYLLNPSDMKTLESRENQKLAVDEYWLQTSDNIEKSRELIRIYYNRVYYANTFFTSFTEGWKTDRGMIYIIYGPPDYLLKTQDKEVWSYGDENNANRLSFTFVHRPHPFSMNYFILQRGLNPESRWRQAVRTWRQGNVFVVGKT